MKIPRDLTGNELATLLRRYGYEVTRQKGSHIRLTKDTPEERHITIPNHNPLKIGTLSSILSELAEQLNTTKDTILHELFG